jgi:hypothetical protein
MLPYLFIPHTNRLDATKRAFDSVIGNERVTVRVIDNTDNGLGYEAAVAEAFGDYVEFAPVQLNMSQMHNYCAYLAREKGDGVSFFLRLHNDGVCLENALDKLLDATEECVKQNRHWGIAMAHYDVLSSWNLNCPEIYWDATRFPWYKQDIDCWCRMDKDDWERINVPGIGHLVLHERDPGTTAGGSVTVNSSYLFRRVSNYVGQMEHDFLEETYQIIGRGKSAVTWNFERKTVE